MSRIAQKNKRVFVGMSGGVDSSVAAYLLKKKGYDLIGVFMRCYNVDGCAEQDAEDARRVAGKLDIPFYVWDFEEEYKKKVVEYMVEGYRRGETPNPDVMCNREIKFGLFLRRALELGADYVATGHYVRLASQYVSTGSGRLFAPAAKSSLDSRASADPSPRRSETFRTKHTGKLAFLLSEAKDKNKDQSYFLWTLTQNELKHCLFPVGDYLKSEVREIARRAGLSTAEKKDSQGICFLGRVSLTDFLKSYIPEKRGSIVSVTGQKLGEHSGAHLYTIGQRHGLDLKEKNSALCVRGEHVTKPHYVTTKNIKTNTLVVAEGSDHSSLYKKEVSLRNVSFISPLVASRYPLGTILARVRYRQLASAARIVKIKNHFKLVFETPQKFVASGQSAVFYDKNGKMLGGGVIS